MTQDDLKGLVIEVTSNKWYYVMPGQNGMRAFGHFSSDEFAIDHLLRNHPNPGTWRLLQLSPGQDAMNLAQYGSLENLIASAGYAI